MSSTSEDRRRAFETERKLAIVNQWLRETMARRQAAGAKGKVHVELQTDDGYIVRALMSDSVVEDDLSDEQWHSVLREMNGGVKHSERREASA